MDTERSLVSFREVIAAALYASSADLLGKGVEFERIREDD
jgi:hypothetical protein